MGQVLNWDKTKAMKFTRSSNETGVLKIEDKIVENVDRFGYLGVFVTNAGRGTTEIRTKIAMAKLITYTKR